MDDIKRFPPGVAGKLDSYVYRLIDPRDGETFYVGKGTGDRVFDHVKEEIADVDTARHKIRRIREIRNAGFEVGHIIHRHAMDDATAREVEAALIDAYPGMTNAIDGAGSEFGVMHAREVIRKYAAKPAEFHHKAILISINRSSSDRTIYEATRFAWRLSKSRARQAEVILPHTKGIIIGAYIAREWLPATSENFPGREDVPGRLGFVGVEAPKHISDLYVECAVPDTLRRRGAANPIRYTWGASEE